MFLVCFCSQESYREYGFLRLSKVSIWVLLFDFVDLNLAGTACDGLEVVLQMPSLRCFYAPYVVPPAHLEVDSDRFGIYVLGRTEKFDEVF